MEEVINGQLVESSPDGTVRQLRSLPEPIPVPPGQRVVRLKKMTAPTIEAACIVAPMQQCGIEYNWTIGNFTAFPSVH